MTYYNFIIRLNNQPVRGIRGSTNFLFLCLKTWGHISYIILTPLYTGLNPPLVVASR